MTPSLTTTTATTRPVSKLTATTKTPPVTKATSKKPESAPTKVQGTTKTPVAATSQARNQLLKKKKTRRICRVEMAPPKPGCESTPYGCCSDAKTAATGPFELGNLNLNFYTTWWLTELRKKPTMTINGDVVWQVARKWRLARIPNSNAAPTESHRLKDPISKDAKRMCVHRRCLVAVRTESLRLSS